MNDGNGINTDFIEEANMHNPQAALFKLRTSTNYKQDERFTGGKNGLGAKLVALLSDHFTVETVY